MRNTTVNYQKMCWGFGISSRAWKNKSICINLVSLDAFCCKDVLERLLLVQIFEVNILIMLLLFSMMNLLLKKNNDERASDANDQSERMN